MQIDKAKRIAFRIRVVNPTSAQIAANFATRRHASRQEVFNRWLQTLYRKAYPD